MKEKTKFVAFSTQKGGAGKTTLTVLAASYLHYVKGFNVAVIDCDYPQHSIVEMRERDLKLALEDEHYKRLAYEHFIRDFSLPMLCSFTTTAYFRVLSMTTRSALIGATR